MYMICIWLLNYLNIIFILNCILVWLRLILLLERVRIFIKWLEYLFFDLMSKIVGKEGDYRENYGNILSGDSGIFC